MKMLILLSLLLATSVGLVAGTCQHIQEDCQLQYGEWSECDPCQQRQSRHLNVTLPSHHGGLPCPSRLYESRPCNPTAECPNDLPCHGLFDCGGGLRCIDPSLTCNGDDDCGNNRDEWNCSSAQFQNLNARSVSECLSLPVLPYLDQLGSGYDTRSGLVQGRVLDHQKYNGYCRKAYDNGAGKSYRLPYNVDDFHFQVLTSADLTTESFDSLANLTQAMNNSDTTTVSGSLHVSYFSFKMSGSMSFTHTQLYQSLFNTFTDRKATMFKLSTKMEVAQYIARDDDLILDPFFKQKVNSLPITFNPQAYFELFAQYGTHYIHSARLGGTYEHYFVVDQDTMSQNNFTASSLATSLKANLKASFMSFHASASGSQSSSNFASTDDFNSFVSVNTTSVVNVAGGTAEAAGKLAAMTVNGTSESTSVYALWVESLLQNPTILSKDIRSICELFISANVSDAMTKYYVCVNATQLFLQPYSSEACLDCKNGGIPVNINLECKCACLKGYQGAQCQQAWPDSFNLEMKRDLGQSSSSSIKFLTSGYPPIAMEPPVLTSTPVGKYDDMLKVMGDTVYTLTSDLGLIQVKNGVPSGQYTFQLYDEYLSLKEKVPIDTTGFDECLAVTGACWIKDYDIDSHGNFFAAVQVWDVTASSQETSFHTTIYKINPDGKVIGKMSRPCALYDISKQNFAYVTVNCDDEVFVACAQFPTTIRRFSPDGQPIEVVQLNGAGATGAIYFSNDRLWIRTTANQIMAFDTSVWENLQNATVPADPYSGSTVTGQIFVDFAGNIITGQTALREIGQQNFKFSIFSSAQTSMQSLASSVLQNWNKCQYVGAYRGKLFTLCENSQNATQRAILTFDYLK